MNIQENIYIVTGASGFIGSELIRRLNQRGYKKILAVDSLETSNKFLNLTDLEIIDYLEKDDFLEKIKKQDSFFENVKGVFHMGACSSTTEKDVSYLIQNNYEYSKKLALWCIKNDIRFVYASSAATYGDGAQGYDDSTLPKELRPLNGYGFSKNLFDNWIYVNKLQNKVVGAKFFNVYGSHEEHKGHMRSFINKLFYNIMDSVSTESNLEYILSSLQKIEKDIVTELYLDDSKYAYFSDMTKDRLHSICAQLFASDISSVANGEQKRDFIYINEVTTNLCDIMLEDEIFAAVSGLVNLGTGEARSFNDLVKIVFRTLFLPLHIEYIEMPQTLQGKYQYYTQANMAKFKAAFTQMSFLKTGYKSISLEEGIQDYIFTYLLPRYLSKKPNLNLENFINHISPSNYKTL